MTCLDFSHPLPDTPYLSRLTGNLAGWGIKGYGNQKVELPGCSSEMVQPVARGLYFPEPMDTG